MPKETDTLENQVTYGNLTILPNVNLDEGDGSLEIFGTAYVDNILANTNGNPVNLEGVLFNNNTITIPDTLGVPTASNTGSQKFYTDSQDNKFKSIDPLNVITVYQPTTNKGDLIVNNGINTQSLPVGKIGQRLTVEQNSTTLLKWETEIITNVVNIVTSDTNLIVPMPIGSNIICMHPLTNTGCSANYIISKSVASLIGNINVLNSNPSTVTSSTFNYSYPQYDGFELQTNQLDLLGCYRFLDSSCFESSGITLTDTTPVIYNTNTTGVFFINIFNDFNGPCSTFMITKSIATSNTCNWVKLNSSPSSTPFTQLTVSWGANQGLSIAKTTSSYQGIYQVVDNFQYTNSQIAITLSGITPTIIPVYNFPYYKKQSFYLSVTSSTVNGPNGIFSVSKNINTNNGNISSTVSLGNITKERLLLTWNTNSLLSLSKNGYSFDGIYILNFTKLN
jgi:hypothetical protein